MGKRGKKGGRGGSGRGGSGANNHWRERTNKEDIERHNDRYERYYNELGIVGEDEKDELWETMRRDLPNSFRFTGSKAHALAVQQRLKDFYIPEITSITHNGELVDAPKPVSWYPDQLAWYMTTPKHIIRRFPPFASFQKFLVAETDVGHISRQEVVSMIPPLCMDIGPGMTVLDLCAAPGSKSAQLIEMVHGGEEERTRTVAHHLANGLDRPTGAGHDDDGRSTGLLIANDIDYRRAHMLVHQMKRLSSANIIVTNHDATVYPSIKIASAITGEGKNIYLKFDRVLADVPCSGDGTCRKNVEIWRTWNPGNALGLHSVQVRILARAIQMLKVGGRVVYSTCSMNPVEDEAVLATAIERCGGPNNVEIVDSNAYLPGLKRYAGLSSWKVMDKQGRIWNSYADVVSQRDVDGADTVGKVQESMFPPRDNLHLERSMRVYPHSQDTGAFFIAILQKKSEIKAKMEEKPKLGQAWSGTIDEPNDPVKVEANGAEPTAAAISDSSLSATAQRETESVTKRQPDDDEAEHGSPKRRQLTRSENDKGQAFLQTDVDADGSRSNEINDDISEEIRNGMPVNDDYKIKKSGPCFEEAFKYLDANLDELEMIRKFYDISPRFPRDRFMVRNATGVASKNIYYTTALAKAVLQENEGKGMKFVHCGVKMFVKQDVPRPDICPWRIQTDGLSILEPWIGPQRRIRLWKRETLRKLLIEMFPRFNGEEWKKLGEIGEQIKEMEMGCCVLQIEPSNDEDGLRERMIFPLWKSLHSLNLMMPKEDRKALLLRLFNDDTPLVNLWQKHANDNTAKVEVKVETSMKQDEIERRRNSSSEGEDEDEDTAEPGGVSIVGISHDEGGRRVADELDAGTSVS